jgi:hypothetical protein
MRPCLAPLNELNQSSIYIIVTDAFKDVILNTNMNIANAFNRFDMVGRVRVNDRGAFGFNGEEDRAVNVLRAIESDPLVIQNIENLRNRIHNIISTMHQIRDEISEIVEEINLGTYRNRIWRCCPSILKEVWRYFW